MVSQVSWSVSHVLLFLAGDCTFTSRVLSPPLMETADGGCGRRKGTIRNWTTDAAIV